MGSALRRVRDVPTADDFRSAVTEVGTLSDSLSTMGRILDDYDTDFGFSGSQIADTVRAAIRAGRNNASGTGKLVSPLIEELNRRAVLCDQFTSDMNAYRRDHPAWVQRDASYRAQLARGEIGNPPGREPQRPTAPFDGAQAS